MRASTATDGRQRRVRHPTLGTGTVRSVVDGGRKLRVEFDDSPGIPWILSASELEGPKKAKRARLRVVPRRAGLGPAGTRQIIEALRLGVIPGSGAERYTVGRDDELRMVADLVEAQRGILVVEGEYGAGKSHLMDIAEAKAREAGFVTSRVELDPREVPPSHPLRVYREIVSRLRYPGEACGDGLEPLAARLVETGSSCWKGKGLHRYLSPLVFAAGRDPGGEAWQAMLSYVEGRGTVHADEVMTLLRRIGWDGPGLLTLADWRTFGQVYAYLLGGIAAWSREAGWKGLAVFFDEAESIDSMGRQSQEFAETFLKYFAAASLPGAELPFRAGELRRGGHRVHREIPHVYRRGQPLIGVFAFTPHPDVGRVVESVVGRGRRIARLEHVGGALMPDLVTRIATVYREAYPGFRAARSDTQRLVRLVRALAGQGAVTSTRDVARLTVEYLDILRLRPDDAGRALEGP